MMDTTMERKDEAGDSILWNNVGVEHLRHGRLDEAYAVLSLAAKLNQEESYDTNVEDCGLYCNQWLNISHVTDAVNAATSLYRRESDVTLNPFPFCLQIGKREDDDMETSVPDKLRDQAVFTSRLDWIIEYNLALVAQLLETICGGVQLLNEAHNLYDQIGKDILEWHDYSATLDMALLLIAIYNNQGCIYQHMGVNEIARFYMDRVVTIYSASSNLEANPICKTFGHNCSLYQHTDCAPAA
eukprot:scaffold733_cov97-Cylindrotheca_fusiformis.AAC.5